MALSRFILCLLSCFVLSFAVHAGHPVTSPSGNEPLGYSSEISVIDLPGHSHDLPLNNINQIDLSSTTSFRILNNFSIVSLVHHPSGILRHNQLQPNASAWISGILRDELHIFNLQLLI